VNVHAYRVIYGDADPMGVMYHANYLRLMEAGRNEYCREQGVTYREIEGAGRFFPVVEAQVKYHRPALYDDVVAIHTWISRRQRVRLEFSYELWRGQDLLLTGTTVHACVDKAGRPQRLPEDWQGRFPVEERQPGQGPPPTPTPGP
jgi:acyl-CoA thioester hydrolase